MKSEAELTIINNDKIYRIQSENENVTYKRKKLYS